VRRRRVLGGLIGLIALAVYLRIGPVPGDLLAGAGGESTVVVDRTGAVLYESLSDTGSRATALAADELPPVVVAATLAAEDRRFWSHPGIDPIAMLRALRINLAERRIVEGGSTISQQVAKLLLSRRTPDRHRGVKAKVHEAVLALRLEYRFSKPEMLALYLNHAAYGNQIVGIERASRAYFGIPSRMLTPAQAALLAGLPQRPSRFNPYRNRDLAVSRQRTVLSRMAASGALSVDEAAVARREELVFVRPSRPFTAPHFVEMVLARAGEPRSSRIETTLDVVLQREVEGIVETQRNQLIRHGARHVAVVVLDNASGEWLAWEGSGDFDAADGGRLNGPTVPRQPGSALKPFTYALAFERDVTPASVLRDAPTHFPTADPGVTYQPRNYDGRYRGSLRARDALGGSLNIPAVVLASHVGVAALLRTYTRAGLTTFDKNAAHYGLGVTLGNAEVRLDELVAAYAAFARGGLWYSPTFLARPIETTRTDSPRQLFSPETAFWITDILSDADARESVFGRGGYLEFPFPVAVKTGTSQAYHDNWTIGFSRHVTIGVWVGNFDRAPLRNSSGVTGAAPIFHAVMLAAERRVGGSIDFSNRRILERPAGLRRVEICALSGRPANAACPTRTMEWLRTETRQARCEDHRDEEHDEPRRATVMASQRVASLAIANPPDGATYLIDPTLRPEFQVLPLRASEKASGPIEWFVNGTLAGSAPADTAVAWPLAPGRHRITARDAHGRIARSTIDVR
jgi:penicillin-binding protein 1C